ncbi:MAG: peptidase [Rickettsiales bacterium]|nr:MAG: peptidase [Rickettsiales bacterium]
MLLRLLIFCSKLALFFGAIGVVVAGYVIYYYSRDLPDYSQLKLYHPPSITRMYSSDGKLIEEYAREHRVFVPITSIPKPLIEAFIAAEDKNFYHHSGVDFVSILRAAITNVSHILNKRRVEGGSTITQQVVKTFLLSSERSLERKIKEAILSYMMSQLFTKDEVMELYLNQIYLGKGAYGVALGALNYFNKSIEELTLNEAAVLASLPKAPSKFNPAVNYKRAFVRKNYVLGRMFDDGYITEEQAREAIAQPITLAKFNKVTTIDADYYAARVREEVINMFGKEYFYTAGLTIMTCVDSNIQKHAARALRAGIKRYDTKRGYRGAIKNIDLINWQDDLRAMPIPIGLRHYKLAVVLGVTDVAAKVGLRDGSLKTLRIRDMKWAKTGLASVRELLKSGDIIAVERKGKKYILQQIPEVNGGIMVVDHRTGRVLAAEGGYDFGFSKFDRTTQANRQPGSLIKPFVYLAAIENGAHPNDIFDDAPIELEQGPGLPLWMPKNHDDKFLGKMTLRKGLEKSRNLVTVRVGQFAGINKVAETIKRFGINDDPLVVQSIVLGSIETTLSKMTMAFGALANNGRKIEPHYIEFIKDRKGNVIYKRDYAECSECKSYKLDEDDNAIVPKIEITKGAALTDEASSYQMTSLMMGGVQRGTSRKAKNLKHVIAGKTGTTNDARDVWFMGYTPKIIVGTYVGYDQPRTLGKRAYGANIALPIFVDFMKKGYKNAPLVDFIVPDSVALLSVDYETGKPSTGENSIIESFKADDYNPFLEKIKRRYKPLIKIQERDSSEELY